MTVANDFNFIPLTQPWAHVLALQPSVYENVIENAVRHCLQADDELSTAELGERLCPITTCRSKADLDVRQKLLRVLQKLAGSLLADCATRGEPGPNRFGRIRHPWRWHAPELVRSCPTCNRPL